MQDYNLKLTLTILSSVVFAMLMILLAFVIPLHKTKEPSIQYGHQKTENRLQEVSKSMNKRLGN